MTTKKTTKKTADDQPDLQKGDAPQVALPKGKGTQDDAPPPSNPEPIPRGEGEREPKERKEDTLRLPEDKARWNYGVSTEDTSELLREQREIDSSNKQ